LYLCIKIPIKTPAPRFQQRIAPRGTRLPPIKTARYIPFIAEIPTPVKHFYTRALRAFGAILAILRPFMAVLGVKNAKRHQEIPICRKIMVLITLDFLYNPTFYEIIKGLICWKTFKLPQD
jgi:hypothetical protein